MLSQFSDLINVVICRCKVHSKRMFALHALKSRSIVRVKVKVKIKNQELKLTKNKTKNKVQK